MVAWPVWQVTRCVHLSKKPNKLYILVAATVLAAAVRKCA